MTCDHKWIDTNYCAKCGISIETFRSRSSYPDDVVAVMRDTITEQRALITRLQVELAALRLHLEVKP